MSNQITIKRVKFRSMKDLLLEQATNKVSEVTGQPKGLWNSILRWRLRHFQGDVSKALTCWTFTEEHPVLGEQVFLP